MSVLRETVSPPPMGYIATPDIFSESVPGQFPYASLAEWYPCAKTGRAGLIRAVEPLRGLAEWNLENDPHYVVGYLSRIKKIRYMSQTALGTYVFPRVGVTVHQPYTGRHHGQLSSVYDIQYDHAEHFVEALNVIPRPDYPESPTHAHDYAPRFAIYDGGIYPFEQGVASLATQNTLLVSNDPEHTSHDMLTHAFAFYGLHRDLANLLLHNIREAHSARIDDPYGVKQAASDFDLHCTVYALQTIHGTSSKVTALGFADATGMTFDEVVSKTIARIDNPLTPYSP